MRFLFAMFRRDMSAASLLRPSISIRNASKPGISAKLKYHNCLWIVDLNASIFVTLVISQVLVVC